MQKVLLWRKKIFSWKISIWVSKKRRILCWFQIRWCRLKQMPLKKLEPKNFANFEYFRFCAFFRGFLLLTFVRGISESRHQQIWNQHKILLFLIPILIFFKKKFFWVIKAFLAILKCKCGKKLYIFKHFAKSKKLFFCQYLSFSVWFLLKFQKKYKIEAPYSTMGSPTNGSPEVGGGRGAIK